MGFTFTINRRNPGSPPGSGTSGRPGCVSRVFGSAFFLVFLGMGLCFTGLMVREAWRTAATYRWPSVPCRIVSSAVSDTGGSSSSPYRFVVSYEYEVAAPGQSEAAAVTYTSQRLHQGPADFSDYSAAQRLVGAYPAGSRAACYVNPADPADAVLQRWGLWMLLFLPIPLLFVAVGGAGVVGMWWNPKRRSASSLWSTGGLDNGSSSAAPMDAAISERAERAASWKGRLGQGIFFGVFLAAGLGTAIPILVLPMMRLARAQAWTPTSCRVVSSRVVSHSGDHDSTYSVDILYEYEASGARHRSNRFDFLGGSSSGYAGKEAVVRQYPAGSERTCFVNPSAPDDAVLALGFRASYLVGLFPLIFVAVGAFGIRNAVFGPRLKLPRERTIVPLPSPPALRSTVRGGRIADDASQPRRAAPSDGGPTVLKSASSPLLRLGIVVLICLFVNGILSVFIVDAVGEWRTARGAGIAFPLFHTVFLVPFVLIGLGLLIGVGYCFLALFNPRPRLTVGSTALAPGGATRLDWQIEGGGGRLTRLRIALEGREEATYRNDKSAGTDRHVFARVVAVDTTERLQMASGRATLTVPADAMHSFAAPNNAIVWRLRVRGEIPRWPDLDQEFAFVVLPPSTGAGGPT